MPSVLQHFGGGSVREGILDRIVRTRDAGGKHVEIQFPQHRQPGFPGMPIRIDAGQGPFEFGMLQAFHLGNSVCGLEVDRREGPLSGHAFAPGERGIEIV